MLTVFYLCLPWFALIAASAIDVKFNDNEGAATPTLFVCMMVAALVGIGAVMGGALK